MKIIDVISSGFLVTYPEIYGKFQEILNFRKIYNSAHPPEKLGRTSPLLSSRFTPLVGRAVVQRFSSVDRRSIAVCVL